MNEQTQNTFIQRLSMLGLEVTALRPNVFKIENLAHNGFLRFGQYQTLEIQAQAFGYDVLANPLERDVFKVVVRG